jgi:hypothetical protein
MTSTAELIEKVARAMTVAAAVDPDEMVPRSGYGHDKNNRIPRWHFNIEWARRHIAAARALGSLNDAVRDGAITPQQVLPGEPK